MIIETSSIVESQATIWTIVGKTARKVFCFYMVSDTSQVDVRENIAKRTEIFAILRIFPHKLDQLTWIRHGEAWNLKHQFQKQY